MKKIFFLIISYLSIFGAGFAQWQPANNGLDFINMRDLAIDPTTKYLYAGTVGGCVYRSTDEGNNWTIANNDISGHDFDVTSISINGSNIFAGTWGGGVFLSTDNGISWTAVNNGLSFLYISYLKASGSNIFASTYREGVFLSTDNGSNWSPANNGLVLHVGGVDNYVNTIAISGNKIFAGTNSFGVFLSTDNGSSWTAENHDLFHGGYSVKSMAITGDNVFAVASGGVFLSSNDGNNWTTMNNGLTSDTQFYLKSIAISGNNIFIGSYYTGILLSMDNGRSWASVNNGLSYEGLTVRSISISENYIFIRTDFAGVWKRLLSDIKILTVNPGSLTLGATANSTQTFDITSNTNWTVSCSESWLEISQNSGFENATITLTAQENSSASPRSAIVTVSGSESQTVLVEQDAIGVITGIEDIENKSIKIYPNPAKEHIVIDMNDYSNFPEYSIRIIDMMGNSVYENRSSQQKYQINSSSLPGKGVYFLQVYDNNNRIKEIKKIILK